MNHEVQAYIDSVSDGRKDLILKLQEIILRNFPEALVRISYNIVNYKLPTGWTFLSYWKQGVTLTVGYLPMLIEFKTQYPKIKTGKGSINFKLTDNIPWDYIEQVISKLWGVGDSITNSKLRIPNYEYELRTTNYEFQTTH
jgi:uncharacterized protein YdhG (YjbR/CyaY superfamily)